MNSSASYANKISQRIKCYKKFSPKCKILTLKVDSILLIDYVLPKQTKHSELGGFMSDTQDQDLILLEMTAKARIKQQIIAEKAPAQFHPGASMTVTGKSTSRTLE
jgi:hypothetical protein